MITLEQAEAMFCEMVANSGKKYQVEKVWEIKFDDPIYVMMAIDKDGNKILPGDMFPSIRKEDGTVVDYNFPCPA